MSRPDYRSFVPDPDKARYAGPTPKEHAHTVLKNPRAQELFGGWSALMAAPYKGLTTDGTVRPDLFTLRPEGAPVAEMIAAVNALTALLDDDQRQGARHPVGSDLWRRWQNTELYVEEHGLRLELVNADIREAVIDVLRASLSEKGVEKTLATMRLNRFLGDVVGAPQILNEWSYIFTLFGEPSLTEPWGWQLFGHHLTMNCLVIGEQMVLTPCFFGAEPTYADFGPYEGLSMFEDEERGGLELMRSLSPDMQAAALVSSSMKAEDHPEGRWHFADHLMLGGAAQDNRVVPYEGLTADKLSGRQRRDLLDLVKSYIDPMPEGPFQARIDDVEKHLAETHFCWIGGTGEENPFYYRIQSPVIFIEFDHHSGVFLNNQEPARFHVHTIVRTPNGNDYGIDLLRLHYAQSDHHHND